jgi:SAM-dependent methyltransferase
MNVLDHWNRGVENVPLITGAATVMDCSDLLDVCTKLGVRVPMPSVLDVGCGTGRWARFCREYVGVDVSDDAIVFAHYAQREAYRIDGPSDLEFVWTRWMYRRPITITCFSVFTHIDRPERIAYLRAFHELSLTAVVDIIPGDGRGNVECWTADPFDFLSDLDDSGWAAVRRYSRVSPDGPIHEYYRLEAR